jgi:hypothetical protein
VKHLPERGEYWPERGEYLPERGEYWPEDRKLISQRIMSTVRGAVKQGSDKTKTFASG